MPVCVCPKVNEMNEKMSFRMGAKFAASFYMGKNFLDIWHVFVSLGTVPEVIFNQCENELNQ